VTAYSGATPADIFGRPLSRAAQQKRRPGSQQSRQRQAVSTVDKNGKRRNTTLKPKAPPSAYRRPKSTPGSRQQPPKQKGKGAK
jgi:hypothetical protein